VKDWWLTGDARILRAIELIDRGRCPIGVARELGFACGDFMADDILDYQRRQRNAAHRERRARLAS
jgi:hypothetical protein